MKKSVLFIFSGILMLGFISCNKCAECSKKDYVYYDGEYCKGNAVKNAVYNSAKAECETAGGTFK